MKNKQLVFSAFIAPFLLFMAVVSGSAPTAEKEVTNIMVGHSPFANLIGPFGPGFELETGIKLNIIGGDSVANSATDSFRMVLSGKAHVGGSGIYWKDYEQLMLKEGITQKEINSITHRIIGNDTLKVVVNEGVKLDLVTMDQLSDLFNGNIKNWKEIGGPDLPVTVILQSQLPGTTAFFKKMVLKGKDFSSAAKKVKDNFEMLEVISKSPGSIAFCSTLMKEGVQTKALKTPEPISRPLTLITKGKPSDSVVLLFKYLEKHRLK